MVPTLRGVLFPDPKLYDLVLMDLRMPVMDGITATREMRNKLHLTLPIVVFTAEPRALPPPFICPHRVVWTVGEALRPTGKDIRLEASKAGATDFLEKPAARGLLSSGKTPQASSQ